MVENPVAGKENIVLTDCLGAQDRENDYGLSNGKSLNKFERYQRLFARKYLQRTEVKHHICSLGNIFPKK